ncbi:MAG: hypothetical protein HXM94_01365 [Parvimonas micra]|uniref:Uncharacterized protein n=1 Tax=Parvimonas micra TaxID=33033 RepID=A0A930H343_9FIRM|nr:hypothetical protein [Parvimonas micra]MBF1306426.1 hypothetical protein [Parvimonas micra]
MKTKSDQLSFIKNWSLGNKNIKEVFESHSLFVSENFNELVENDFIKSILQFKIKEKSAILQTLLILSFYKDSESIKGDLEKALKLINKISLIDNRFKFKELPKLFKESNLWKRVFFEVGDLNNLRKEFDDAIELILFIDKNGYYSVDTEQYKSNNQTINEFLNSVKVLGVLTTSININNENNNNRSGFIEEFGFAYLSALIIQDFDFLVEEVYNIAQKLENK